MADRELDKPQGKMLVQDFMDGALLKDDNGFSNHFVFVPIALVLSSIGGAIWVGPEYDIEENHTDTAIQSGLEQESGVGYIGISQKGFYPTIVTLDNDTGAYRVFSVTRRDGGDFIWTMEQSQSEAWRKVSAMLEELQNMREEFNSPGESTPARLPQFAEFEEISGIFDTPSDTIVRYSSESAETALNNSTINVMDGLDTTILQLEAAATAILEGNYGFASETGNGFQLSKDLPDRPNDSFMEGFLPVFQVLAGGLLGISLTSGVTNTLRSRRKRKENVKGAMRHG